MGTEHEPSAESRIPAFRLDRMKHMRIDRMSFADMVPVLLEADLIPEHGNHMERAPRVQGRRGEKRVAEVCGHCEHLLHEQWKRNITNLSADEAVLLEARWLWMNGAARQIVKYESLAMKPIVTVTTVRRAIEAKEGEPQAEAFMVETTTKEERRSNAQFFKMADDLRANIARLAGVPVGDLSRVPTPQGAGRGKAQLVVRERTDADEQRDEQAN